MKILLIRPDLRNFPVPPPYMPIGLLYLASYLEQHRIEVRVLDFNTELGKDAWGNLDEVDVIGFSMLSHARSQVYNLIREVKRDYAHIKMVVGGQFVCSESIAKKLLEKYSIDSVIAGEGESTLLQYCENLESSRWGGILEKIDAGLLNLDNLPFPAWQHSNFNWDMQIAKSRPDIEANGVRIGDALWAPIITSRGCKGRCYFCNSHDFWNNEVRFRSGKNIADEMEKLVKDYNVHLFSIDDDNFPANKQQCLDLCEEIRKRNLKVAWKCDTRIDCLDRETIQAMKSAGCFMVAIGLESGSEKILRMIRKGISLEQAREVIKDLKETGILAYTLLMIGNVGETEDTIKETKKFLDETRPDLKSFVIGVMVLPGTPLQKIAGVPDEFYLEGDGLPYYTKEHTTEELTRYANLLNG